MCHSTRHIRLQLASTVMCPIFWNHQHVAFDFKLVCYANGALDMYAVSSGVRCIGAQYTPHAQA